MLQLPMCNRIPVSIIVFTFSCMCLFISLFILIGGWTRKCGYGTGNCRKSCKENEKKKEKCGLRKLCCIPIKHNSSKLVIKEETTYRIMASTTKYEFMTCDKRILAAFQWVSKMGIQVTYMVLRSLVSKETGSLPDPLKNICSF